jgi:hypothetical protein
MSVPIEWERLQALRRGAATPPGTTTPPPERAYGVTVRRSNSSGDAGIPFGVAIPEGGPYNPALHPGAGSPFSNDMHAVATGGMMSLSAQQQFGLLSEPQQLQLLRGSELRRSENTSPSGEPSSLHSITSDGLASSQQASASSMAGMMLEGLGEWEIQPEEIVLGPRIGIGRCACLHSYISRIPYYPAPSPIPSGAFCCLQLCQPDTAA